MLNVIHFRTMGVKWRLEEKFREVIVNRWFWAVFALVVLVSVTAYAFYCTHKGFNFGMNANLRKPKITQMQVGCTR